MSEWREVTLEEIASPDRYSVVGGPFGSSLGRKDYVEEGVPVIRGAQLGGPGLFSNDDFVYVSEEKADRHLGNLAFPGDVLVTQRGTVGQIGFIPLNAPFERYLLSQSQMKLTVDPARAEARFVYYWLRSPEAQHTMVGSTISAGVPHINLETFKSLKLRLPPPEEQASIANVLGAIDDLIENNRRRVEVLEEIARTIYREWFVRFRYPGHENVPLVDSALGPIPEGWSIGSLGDLAALDRVNIQPRDSPGELFDHYSIPAFDDGARPVVEPGGAIKSGKYLLSTAAVLVSKLNPRIDRVWFAEPGTEQRSVTSTEFLILRPNERSHLEHLYLLARDPKFREQLTALSGGTSGSHQRAKPADFLKLPVAVAPAAVLDILAKATSDQLRLARQLARQGNKLAGLRDLLLPKLVTGQIDVSHLDLNALTEAATA